MNELKCDKHLKEALRLLRQAKKKLHDARLQDDGFPAFAISNASMWTDKACTAAISARNLLK